MKVLDYLKETKGEFRHVTWPTRKQATAFTLLVIIISLLTAAYLGLFDYIFSIGLERLISFFGIN